MKKKQTLTGILVMILAIALDQLTKQWAKRPVPIPAVTVING